MRKAAMLFTLGMVGTGFCMDEYLPIEAGKLEVDVGYGFLSATGIYDSSGSKEDLPDGSSITGHNIPLQLKYGIMPGLEVSLGWAFSMLSTEMDFGPLGKFDTTLSGFAQPEIAVKYAMMDLGLGFFADFIAPFATGDLADPDQPPMALMFGALYTKTFVPNFRLTSMAGYRLNFEGENKVKDGNVITVLAKPEYVINPFAGIYLGLREDIASEGEFDGTGADDAGHLFTLAPGWNALWLPNVATEVNVPITLFGQENTAAWGINANVYITLL